MSAAVLSAAEGTEKDAQHKYKWHIHTISNWMSQTVQYPESTGEVFTESQSAISRPIHLLGVCTAGQE